MKEKGLFKKFICVVIFIISFESFYAEGAKAVVDFILHAESGADGSVNRVIGELEKAVSSAETPSDRRSILVFLGSIQEHAGHYADASWNYALAAEIAAPPAAGMARVTAEQLVINAVRCSLSTGDYMTAERYLASDVKNSPDPAIQAYIKLYMVWCLLSKAQTESDLTGAVALLDSYAASPALEIVRPALLLTSWYIDPTSRRRDALVSAYPDSLEAGIVQGRASLLPSPFWFFLPKRTGNAPQPLSPQQPPAQTAQPQPPPTASDTAQSRLLQLGVFRILKNAENLAADLKNAGFTASITTQMRSGEAYFVVTVNDTGDMLRRLQEAGFEAFPLR